MSRITKDEEFMRAERRRSPVAGFGFAQPARFGFNQRDALNQTDDFFNQWGLVAQTV